jgi:hypothetical protein
VAEPERNRDLPAPYVNPWSLLRHDLWAVLASQRLALWELWRRNRQGDLPLPDGWPRGLAAGFWPLLLGLVLLLLGGLGVWAMAARQAAPGPEVQQPLVQVDPARPPVPAPAPAPAPDPAPVDPAAPAPTAAPPVPAPVEPEAPAAAPEPDPRLAPFAAVDPQGLVQAARQDPANGWLELTLAERWQQLAVAEQDRLAQLLQGRALELGYERLSLLDGQGRVLARSARVGSGMILLAHPVSTTRQDAA